jgi:hypothetical protein
MNFLKMKVAEVLLTGLSQTAHYQQAEALVVPLKTIRL